MPVAGLQSSVAPPSRVGVRKGPASDRTVRQAVVGLRGLVQSQVLQYFLDDVGVLNTGDHPDPPATLLAFLYVDGEHAFEPLCGAAIRPGH